MKIIGDLGQISFDREWGTKAPTCCEIEERTGKKGLETEYRRLEVLCCPRKPLEGDAVELERVWGQVRVLFCFLRWRNNNMCLY